MTVPCHDQRHFHAVSGVARFAAPSRKEHLDAQFLAIVEMANVGLNQLVSFLRRLLKLLIKFLIQPEAERRPRPRTLTLNNEITFDPNAKLATATAKGLTVVRRSSRYAAKSAASISLSRLRQIECLRNAARTIRSTSAPRFF